MSANGGACTDTGADGCADSRTCATVSASSDTGTGNTSNGSCAGVDRTTSTDRRTSANGRVCVDRCASSGGETGFDHRTHARGNASACRARLNGYRG